MVRQGPTQTVIWEKLEIRIHNGPFQGHKNGKLQQDVKRENYLYYYLVINSGTHFTVALDIICGS
jgi:hypothetical protein